MPADRTGGAACSAACFAGPDGPGWPAPAAWFSAGGLPGTAGGQRRQRQTGQIASDSGRRSQKAGLIRPDFLPGGCVANANQSRAEGEGRKAETSCTI